MRDDALPNLLIIGAMKCGTSSLHFYLNLHPEVQMSQPKELHFFLDQETFDPGPFIAYPREARLFGEYCCWHLGIDWYKGFFSADAAIRGESSVAYTYPWHHGVADRIAQVTPQAKLIYMVRNPIERSISHYLQYRLGGREWRPLSEALASPNNGYLAPSRYASILAPYLARFPRSSIHIVRNEALLEQRRETLQEIFRFLGVDQSFWSDQMTFRRNRAAAKGRSYRLAERVRSSHVGAPLRRLPVGLKSRIERLLSAPEGSSVHAQLEPELEARLLEELEPEIAGLERLTGWDLSAWRVPAAESASRVGAADAG